VIVVDASALIEAMLFKGPASERLQQELLCAPYLVDVEFVSAIRWNLRHGNVESQAAHDALEEFMAADVLRYTHDWLLGRAWELRENLTPYDALYVALAEALDEVLVTADAGIAKAPGIQARVEVLPVGG